MTGRARKKRPGSSQIAATRQKIAAVGPPSSAQRAVYWLTLVVLVIVQWHASGLATHQIRYEDLAESVRNVFWLDDRLVYDGISSNIGWYGALLMAYKIFGFSLASAKWVRLVLHFVGLVCAADLLRRWMAERRAILPLLLIGLSPTVLYFNTLQTSYGVDVSYASVSLWLVLSIRVGTPSTVDLLKTMASGLVAMIAAMSYPTFLLYLPSLAIIAVWWFRRANTPPMSVRWMTLHGVVAIVGLAIPLLLALALLHNSGLLVYDSATHAGLFRGGARIGWDWTVMAQSLRTVVGDLFDHGQSYNFELTRPDFSGVAAMLALSGVVATTIYLGATGRADRVVLSAVLILLVANLVGPNLSVAGPPGIRRGTGILTAWFALYALAWHFYATATNRGWIRYAGMLLCALAVLDSAIKIPALFDDARADSLYRDSGFFAIQATPAQSLDQLLTQLDHGQVLACPVDQDRRILPCRYQEIYAAIAGFRRWNGLPSVEIRALDWKTGGTIVLSPALWNDHYFPH